MTTGIPNDVSDSFYDFFVNKNFFCLILQKQNFFHTEYLVNMLKVVGNTKVIIVDFKLSFFVYVTKNNLDKKPVELRSRQWIGAFHLNRVLSRYRKKKFFKRISSFSHCYLVFGHTFQ